MHNGSLLAIINKFIFHDHIIEHEWQCNVMLFVEFKMTRKNHILDLILFFSSMFQYSCELNIIKHSIFYRGLSKHLVNIIISKPKNRELIHAIKILISIFHPRKSNWSMGWCMCLMQGFIKRFQNLPSIYVITFAF